MNDVQTRFENLTTWPPNGETYPAVWRDKAGVMHSAVGAEVHRGIRLMWTAWQKKDIPGGGAWLQTSEDRVTCEGCLAAIRIEEEEQRDAELANGQFGVGA